MRLFTFQTIPSLGIEELQSANIEKIREFSERVKNSKRKKKKRIKQKGDVPEEDQEKDETLKEAKTLLYLLEYITDLDKLLQTINSRRGQYTKG